MEDSHNQKQMTIEERLNIFQNELYIVREEMKSQLKKRPYEDISNVQQTPDQPIANIFK